MKSILPSQFKIIVYCGPKCLQLIANYYGKEYDLKLLGEVSNIGSTGVSMLGLIQGAEKIGFNAICVEISLESLALNAPLPCILHWAGCHFVVLDKIEGTGHKEGRNYFITDPSLGQMSLNEANFSLMWLKASSDNPPLTPKGIALLLEPISL